MFWISSGKDLALWMNLLRWPILSAIAVNQSREVPLELHLEHLFIEHGLRRCDAGHHRKLIKNPISLFPFRRAYHDTEFPVENLRMLAVKTTCKDRWRQILNEADNHIQVPSVYLGRSFSGSISGDAGVGCPDWSCHHLSAQKYPEAVIEELS
ncbi:EcoRII-C domain-containing protein [Escherichia coli]|nr:EcoRII-C domain-containing protein [Escherichia coli]